VTDAGSKFKVVAIDSLCFTTSPRVYPWSNLLHASESTPPTVSFPLVSTSASQATVTIATLP
jgi:hypothetical protein